MDFVALERACALTYAFAALWVLPDCAIRESLEKPERSAVHA